MEKSGAEKVKGSKYSKDNLEKAVESVKNKSSSIYAAAKKFGVPESTIRDAIKKRYNQKVGRVQILTEEEESELAKWILDCSAMGDPKMKFEVLEAASEILSNSENDDRKFKNEKPTNSWFRGFMKRNPEISLRKPESITRASGLVSRKNIESFFDSVSDWLTKNMKSDELSALLNNPARWLNADESGFELNASPSKVCARRGAKHVQRIQSGKPKAVMTVTYCFSADGFMYEPVILFPETCTKIQDVAFALGSKIDFSL